jgi:hypothetical protein
VKLNSDKQTSRCAVYFDALSGVLCSSVPQAGHQIYQICSMAKLTVWERVTAEFDARPVNGSYAVENGMVKVKTSRGQKATQVGVFNSTWLARYLLRELAAEGKA